MTQRLQLLLGGLVITLLAIFPFVAQQGAKGGEWRAFGAEEGSTSYSPLDQINRDNIKDLKSDYGNLSSQSLATIQRQLLVLSESGGPSSPSRSCTMRPSIW